MLCYYFTFVLLVSFLVRMEPVRAQDDGHRVEAKRLRKPSSSSIESASMADLIPDYGQYFKTASHNSLGASTEDTTNGDINEFEAVMETLDSILGSGYMSMTPPPSATPTSPSPSSSPSTRAPSFTGQPTLKPSHFPSAFPSVSQSPTVRPTASPTTSTPTASPSSQPSVSTAPSSAPSLVPSATPTLPVPTSQPTTEACGIPEQERIAGILAALDSIADPDRIRNNSFPQGLATTWLIEADGKQVCPGNRKLIQRWTLAVIYFSTNGNSWFQCSDNQAATDICGAEDPFVGKTRFLSENHECTWAGVSCIDGCVTELEFEENNLVGTIPTEIGLLSDLAIWGMERGGLTGSIPTHVGMLTNLIFIDLDFNSLTGSLSSELLSLSSLTQLDLNNNQLTGSISGIGVFPEMEFLQLHDNFFTGTIPPSLGDSTRLAAFTLHETEIGGVMPQSICDLLVTAGNGGVLGSLIADCTEPDPDIVCTCCTDCRDT